MLATEGDTKVGAGQSSKRDQVDKQRTTFDTTTSAWSKVRRLTRSRHVCPIAGSRCRLATVFIRRDAAHLMRSSNDTPLIRLRHLLPSWRGEGSRRTLVS